MLLLSCVLVDSERVEHISSTSWHELRYRPHIAAYQGQEIVIIVLDRELSNFLESGIAPDWFIHEVAQRTQHCDFPALPPAVRFLPALVW